MSDRPPHYTDLNGTERDIIRAVATLQATHEGLPAGEAVGDRILSERPDNFSISQVYRVLSKLHTEGLVFKTDSETDKRAFKTGLTPAGKAVLRELEALYLDLVPLSELEGDEDTVETKPTAADQATTTAIATSPTTASTSSATSTDTTTQSTQTTTDAADETPTTKGTGGGVSDPQIRACWARGAARDIRDFLIKLDDIESKRQVAAAVDVPPRIVKVAVENYPEWFEAHEIPRNGFEVEAYSITAAGIQAAHDDDWSEIG